MRAVECECALASAVGLKLIPEGILGSIEELHLGVGDEVSEDDVIAVVETDKVSLDIKATRSGVVKAVLVEVGQTVKEEEAIYELETS